MCFRLLASSMAGTGALLERRKFPLCLQGGTGFLWISLICWVGSLEFLGLSKEIRKVILKAFFVVVVVVFLML